MEEKLNTVLTKIAEVQVDELPKSIYAKDMEIDVEGMVQSHVASELSDKFKCQNMMLHSNST